MAHYHSCVIELQSPHKCEVQASFLFEEFSVVLGVAHNQHIAQGIVEGSYAPGRHGLTILGYFVNKLYLSLATQIDNRYIAIGCMKEDGEVVIDEFELFNGGTQMQLDIPYQLVREGIYQC